MADGFAILQPRFVLFGADWRVPQVGAIGSILSAWTTRPGEPCLISLPTGAGKTGVALAAPFLARKPPRRVLVLVPSVALREQMFQQFSALELLFHIGALTGRHPKKPLVVAEIKGSQTDWSELEDADVVIARPQSISPATEGPASPPPDKFFDMVVVDEAHHVPARTWAAVLDHVGRVETLLLTATPFRLDRKPLPGNLEYYYPLRRAIEESIYKPIRPELLPRPEPFDPLAKDEAIRDRVVELFSSKDHETSALLIRSRTRKRAAALAEMYRSKGVETEVLHSGLPDARQNEIRAALIAGSLRSVAVVGMLGEGFDLSRLRLVAYHDKHKSMPATIQLIGRLARVDEKFPQESVLVTVKDGDVYPELRGVVNELYREDPDWATIIPRIVDDEVEKDRENRAFVAAFAARDGEVDPATLNPMPGPVIFEITDPEWRLVRRDAEIPERLAVGSRLAGAVVVYSALDADSLSLTIVTRRKKPPVWSTGPALEDVEYGLHVVSFRPRPEADLPSLLFVDVRDGRIRNALADLLAIPSGSLPVSGDRVDGYLQSLERVSVSSIGMRNVLAATRGTSYRMRAGSGTDADLSSNDTTNAALGHVMMQTRTSSGTASVGGAHEKGKLWQRRYKPLREYTAWISEAAQLLWYPRTAASGNLLPQVARGHQLLRWPTADAVAIELHRITFTADYQLFLDDQLLGPLIDFELHADVDPTGTYVPPARTDKELPLVGVMRSTEDDSATAVWLGLAGTDGRISSVGKDLEVRLGYSQSETFADFISDYPPLFYFLNGQSVQGQSLFDTFQTSVPRYNERLVASHDWVSANVDIRSETRAQAVKQSLGQSIHEEVEQYLISRPPNGKYRWVLCNDGSGEIADHLVIEFSPPNDVFVGLWHSKFAAGAPGLRVDDFQVVTAQAIRSRSWLNSPRLWTALRDRLQGRAKPEAVLVAGSASLSRLLVLLGEQAPGGQRRRRSWDRVMPAVRGELAIVQPGLSKAKLEGALSGQPDVTATSLRQLFSVFEGAAFATGADAIVLSSQ